MEMHQVRYFLAVARELNFTRAAESCHVAQPSLTRAIKQLEDEFGGELFRRDGFSNMLDYVKVDGPDAFVDLSTLTRDQAAAIQEVTVEDYKDGRGENARDVRRVKVKLSDKRAALVDIGKHLGMFKELHEHSGKDGGPIKVEGRPINDIEAARRVAFALGRVLERQEAAKGKG